MSERPVHAEVWLSVTELAEAVGLHPARIERLIVLGILEPERVAPPEVPPPAFSAREAARLRRILRLRADLGVRFHDGAIIVDLLERLERVEAELERLRSGSGNPGAR